MFIHVEEIDDFHHFELLYSPRKMFVLLRTGICTAVPRCQPKRKLTSIKLKDNPLPKGCRSDEGLPTGREGGLWIGPCLQARSDPQPPNWGLSIGRSPGSRPDPQPIAIVAFVGLPVALPCIAPARHLALPTSLANPPDRPQPCIHYDL